MTSVERQRRNSQGIQKQTQEDILIEQPQQSGRVPALCVPVSVQPESRELLIQIRALTEEHSGMSTARLTWTILSPRFRKAWLAPWHEWSDSLEHHSYILQALKSSL